MVEEIFITGLIAATVRIATPILLAAHGENIAERSGVLNIGVEGMMIMSAFISFSAIYFTGDYWVGLLAGMGTGMLIAAIHAFMSISLKVNQIVSGLALTILGLALSTYLYISFFGRTIVLVQTWETTAIPILSEIPIIGQALFNQHLLTYFAIIFTIISSILIYRTTRGLSIRSVGENPLAADTAGVKVQRTRYFTTVFGGLMAGVAGVCLTSVNFNSFFSGMTAGRGWIAIAVVIFARWRPSWVLVGAMLFGFLDAFQLRLQAMGFPIPKQLILMTPYLLTLIALVIVSRRAYAPAALGTPYVKGEKG